MTLRAKGKEKLKKVAKGKLNEVEDADHGTEGQRKSQTKRWWETTRPSTSRLYPRPKITGNNKR